MANPYGDVELDARGMRALAHPVRLAILTRLQADGPSTATRLSETVGASPSVTSWHLRQLAAHGLVRDASDAAALRDHGRERWWEAVSRGFRFAADAGRRRDRGGPRARAGHGERRRGHRRPLARGGRAPPGTAVAAAGRPGQHPDRRHRRPSSRRSRRPSSSVLAPYVLRKDEPDDTYPSEARWVRLLRYTLPAADPEASEDPVS